MFFGKKVTLITHSGTFHADDVFACATLQLFLDRRGKKYRVIRTRDQEWFETGDYVFDVGGEYAPENNRFDHHQKGGAGVRNNTIPYAAFGLVWKQFGSELCGSQEVADRIDEKIVQPIDADDNGVAIFETKYDDITPYTIQSILGTFRPTWKEEQDYDNAFLDLVSLAKQILARQIKKMKDKLEGKQFVDEAYSHATDKRLVVVDRPLPWEEFLAEYPEPLFVVYPKDNVWRIGTIRKEPYGFELRKELPESWAGLRDKDMAHVSGVSDATFCHNGRFLAVAKSKEGALELARKALEN